MVGVRTGIAELEAMLRDDPTAHFHLTPDGRVVINMGMTNLAEPEAPTVDLNIPHNAEERAKMTGYDRKNADSYGHKLVGFTFNPSGDAKVARLKGLFAEIIDICHDEALQPSSVDALAIWNEAMMRSLDAQMWTVKAATWPKAK